MATLTILTPESNENFTAGAGGATVSATGVAAGAIEYTLDRNGTVHSSGTPTTQGTSGNFAWTIDFSGLPAGTYKLYVYPAGGAKGGVSVTFTVS